MGRESAVVVVVVMLLVLVLGRVEEVTGEVTCSPIQLSSCAPAITSPAQPTRECCDKLKEQRPCLCKYIRDPTLRGMINSPGARKVADACSAPYPNCN